MKYLFHFFAIYLTLLFSVSTSSAQNRQVGEASFYADKFHGRTTASGAKFDQNKMTAAHRTLPFGTRVQVTNLSNHRKVVVTINDRGPYSKGRIIDLSKAAAKKLDFIKQGVAKVEVVVLSGKSPQPKTQPSGGSSAPRQGVYYELRSNKANPQGYGIQVASYKEAANLVARCEELEHRSSKEVIVQVSSVRGQKFYRLIVGSFRKRDDAERYQKKLRKYYKGCYVVKY